MSEPSFKFSSLSQMLRDLGFEEAAVTKPFIGFRHDASDTLIVLPSYRKNARVARHHLAQVRVMLDAKGLLAEDEFDRIVGCVPARHSASS
jgi:hypothetical protein